MVFKMEKEGEWRQRHIDKLHDLYGRPDTVRCLKLFKRIGAKHMIRMVEERTLFLGV